MDGKEVLALPMQDNDAEATTVRDYLIALLVGVWVEREGFSGKRPFGNSGWQYDLYEPLATAGAIVATFDEDGYFESMADNEKRKADALIMSAIEALS